jgi:CheY-like chemotaxis protein
MKVSFTTGELARIFNVTDETIRNWIKRGIIEVTKLPSGRNQIDRHTVLSLMRKYNIPPDRLREAPHVKVLLADKSDAVRTQFERNFADRQHFDVTSARNSFECGFLTREFRPDVLILDVFFDTDVRDICQFIKSEVDVAKTRIVAMSSQFTDDMKESWGRYGFDAFLVKPFTKEDVQKAVEEALEAAD